MTAENNEFLNFFLDEAPDVLNGWEKACLSLEQDPSQETREELYRAAHNLKSGSGAVNLTEFHELVHTVEDVIAKILNRQLEVSGDAIRTFLGTHSLLSSWVEHLRAGRSFDPGEQIADIKAQVAVLLGQHDAPAVLASEEDAPAVSEETPPASVPAADEGNSIESVKSPEKTASKGAVQKESIRVAAAKLDNLIQLVGELSMQQAILWHGKQNDSLGSKSCDVAIHLIQKIAKDLQNLALSLRLQPLQNLFQRLERAGRDLARSQGKRIEFETAGDFVELDKSVAERIADALTHIIRNAIDHGVEQPEERLAKGKTEQARVRLEASQEPNGILIKIRDDGRGLNAERILRKALERGIVKADAQLAESDIHRLIFHAGLSTAEKVTDVSGRGVGMDVVKTAVESIGGTIDLASQENRGTSFLIALPATLSIIDALIVSVDGNQYCIPLQDVAEIIDLRELEVQTMPAQGRLISLRRRMIPVESLQKHLPLGQSIDSGRFPGSLKGEDKTEGMRPALMIRSNSGLLAFEVDRLAGQQSVTVRSLPGLLSQIPGYTGSTILGDGNPTMILNLPALANRYFEQLQHFSALRQENAAEADEAYSENNDRFLIFELSGHTFGSPLMNIREIVDGGTCEAIVGSSPYLRGSLNVRGQLLPVFSLRDIFGLPVAAKGQTYLVMEHPEGTRAVQVDRIASVTGPGKRLAIDGQGFEKQLRHLPGFVGFLNVADRSVPLIDFQQTLNHLGSIPTGNPQKEIS